MTTRTRPQPAALDKYKDFMPLPVDGPAAAFGAMGQEFKKFAPMYFDYKEHEVPEEFRHHDSTMWHYVVGTWFFGGLKDGDLFTPREGVDPTAALAHVGAVLRSFEPDHLSKEVIAAYLMWLWFDDYKPSKDHADQYKQNIKWARKTTPKREF